MIGELCAAVFARRAVFVALEHTVVVRGGGKAYLAGNVKNAFFALGEQLFAFTDADEIEIVDEARAACLFEHPTKIGGIDPLDTCDLLKRDVLGVMVFDIGDRGAKLFDLGRYALILQGDRVLAAEQGNHRVDASLDQKLKALCTRLRFAKGALDQT